MMMSDTNREQLLRELVSEDSKVRCQAALELARQGDPMCIDVLTQALLKRDWDSCRLYDAEELLGQFRDKRVVDTLIQVLFDPHPSHLALYAMLPLLKTHEPTGIEAVITMMGHWSPIFRSTAAGLIADLGSPIVGRLLIELKDESAERRGMTAYALGQIGDSEAVESLIAMLDDDECFVRRYVAAALGFIGDQRAVTPLVPVLQDIDWETRNCAAEALLKLEYTPRTMPLDVLLNNLRNSGSHVRIETLRPLIRVADPYTIPALVHAMKTDEHRGVRLYAAQALGAIGDMSAVPDLLGSLDDEDELVQQSVRAALEKLGHASGGIAP
jgi:HEAT repeat protein